MINFVIQAIELQPNVLYLEAVAICVSLLLVLFFLNFRSWMYKKINYLSATYVLIILCAISDLIWYFVDGRPGWVLFNRYMQLGYLIIYPIAGFTWLCYCLESLEFKKTTNAIIKHIGVLSLVASTAFNIISLWNGMIFYVNDAGEYFRGNFYVLNPATTFVNLALATGCSIYGAVKAKLDRDRKNRLTLAAFLLPVLAASIVQLILPPGIPIMYFGIGISFLGLFMNSLDDQITEDKLTKTLNHFAFDKALDEIIKKYNTGNNEDKELWMVVLDIENFHQYNSTNGFLAGDRALEFAGQVIRQASAPLKATVGRIGADVFAVIIEAKDSLAPSAFLQAVDRIVKTKNEDMEEPIPLSFYTSYFLHQGGLTRQEFVAKSKALMAEAKKEKKAAAKK